MSETGNGNSAPTRISGAQVKHNYLVRTQSLVAVSATDLSELLTFDALQQGLMGVGLFFLSGGIWLGIEKLSEQETFALTPVISFCLFASITGLILTVVGFVLWLMRRSKIKNIFSETHE